MLSQTHASHLPHPPPPHARSHLLPSCRRDASLARAHTSKSTSLLSSCLNERSEACARAVQGSGLTRKETRTKRKRSHRILLKRQGRTERASRQQGRAPVPGRSPVWTCGAHCCQMMACISATSVGPAARPARPANAAQRRDKECGAARLPAPGSAPWPRQGFCSPNVLPACRARAAAPRHACQQHDPPSRITPTWPHACSASHLQQRCDVALTVEHRSPQQVGTEHRINALLRQPVLLQGGKGMAQAQLQYERRAVLHPGISCALLQRLAGGVAMRGPARN